MLESRRRDDIQSLTKRKVRCVVPSLPQRVIRWVSLRFPIHRRLPRLGVPRVWAPDLEDDMVPGFDLLDCTETIRQFSVEAG